MWTISEVRDNTRKGRDNGNREWTPATIRGMLGREIYTGLVVFGKTRYTLCDDNKKRKLLAPREDWTVVECPELAIISTKTFDQARQE